MNHKQPDDGNRKPPPENGDIVARLLRLAGPRPSVPPERTMRVKGVVQSRWRAKVRARRRIRWTLMTVPAAAALALAFFLLPSPPTPTTDFPPQLVARLQTAMGTGAQILFPGSTRLSRLGIGGTVFEKTTVLTGADGRVALQLSSGVSLRLNKGTRVRLISRSKLLLEQGTVYVDNPTVGSERARVEIHTPFGIARDVGTQFEARIGEQSLRLRVREGTVVLHREDQFESAHAGVEISVNRDEGTTRRSIPVYGPEWEWVTLVAPRFEIEGHRLDGFLAWISREMGRPVHFQREDLQRSASSIVLHGNIDGLSLEEALETVLPTCGLTHRASEGKIYIRELDAESYWR